MELRVKTILLSLVFLFCFNPANAQTVPPKEVEAGTINKDIEEKKYHRDLVDEKEKEEKQTDEQEARLKMNVEEYEKLPAEVKKTGFILKEIDYQGNTVFTDEELDKISAEYFDTFVTLDDLRAIMNEITGYYNNEGYITSFAYLPAQGIQDGRVKLSVVEGKISRVKVKGNKWARDSYLKNNILKANGVKEGKVLNVSNLRKTLGKINETDYLKGRVILNKGDTIESSEIILDVEDRFPIDVRAGWNNQGRELIGKQRAVLTLGNENITGYGDRAYASTIFARDTFGVATDYFLPLGPYGTELRVGYGYTDLEVGKVFKTQGFRGESHGLSTSILQPIYEGETTKLTSDFTLDALRAKTFTNNSTLYEKYNLRAFRFGLNGIKDDSSGRWVSRFELSTGLPIMGATTEQVRTGGSSKFFRLNPSLIRIQSLPYEVTGLFKLAGQYAPSRLLTVEQLQMGGMNTVRGYREGTLFAHSGYFLTAEFRRPIPYLPDYKYLPLKDRVQLAAFYDQGLGKVRGQTITSDNFLHSVGFGFRIRLTEYLNANLDFGFPIGGSVTGREKDPLRFHFRITSDII